MQGGQAVGLGYKITIEMQGVKFLLAHSVYSSCQPCRPLPTSLSMATIKLPVG